MRDINYDFKFIKLNRINNIPQKIVPFVNYPVIKIVHSHFLVKIWLNLFNSLNIPSFINIIISSQFISTIFYTFYIKIPLDSFQDRFESRYHHKQRVLNAPSNAMNVQKGLSLNSKPPAPPPRPCKPALHHGSSLENCKDLSHYSAAMKMVAPSFEEALKLPEFSPPGSKSSTLSSDWRSFKQMSSPVAG